MLRKSNKYSQLTKKKNLFENSRKSFKYKKLLRQERSILLKYGSYLDSNSLFKSYYLRQTLLSRKKNFPFVLSVSISSNNIFLNFSKWVNSANNNVVSKNLLSTNSGMYNLKTTKKTLHFNIKIILLSFTKKVIKNFIFKHSSILVRILGPIRLRKEITSFFAKVFTHNQLFIDYIPAKCFNGCKVPKRRRKKSRVRRLLVL